MHPRWEAICIVHVEVSYDTTADSRYHIFQNGVIHRLALERTNSQMLRWYKGQLNFTHRFSKSADRSIKEIEQIREIYSNLNTEHIPMSP